MLSQKPNHDAKNIGARFRSARSLVPDLNRKSFCERYGINRYTMQSWENGLHVSKGKNVEKFIEALAREGVFCTSEWLIEGIGEPAKPLSSINGVLNSKDHDLGNPQESKFSTIINELIELYKGESLLVSAITDNVMAPKFVSGDVVIAKRIEKTSSELHQKYCIIELSPLRTVTRKVLATKDGFLLLALDEKTPTITLSLESRLYEVLWHLMDQEN
jgi:hypothetical protein